MNKSEKTHESINFFEIYDKNTPLEEDDINLTELHNQFKLNLNEEDLRLIEEENRALFLEKNEFEEIELIHWSFMGNKFLPEIKHILSLYPEYINAKNLVNDTPLLLAASSCSFDIFNYLYSFPGCDSKVINQEGNILDNLFFKNNSPTQHSIYANLEKKIEQHDFEENTYKILSTIYQEKNDVNRKELSTYLFKILQHSDKQEVFQKKKVGFLKFLIEQYPESLFGLNENNYNILFLIAENSDDNTFYLLEKYLTEDQMKTLISHLDNKSETILFKLFYPNKLRPLKVTPLINFINYGFLDLLEKYLEDESVREIILIKSNGIDIFDAIDKQLAKRYLDEDVIHFFNYVKRTLNNYID